MPDIIRHDRVKIISGCFKNKKGYVTKVHGDKACVVIATVWLHGIWLDSCDLKRTKRYKSEQEGE